MPALSQADGRKLLAIGLVGVSSTFLLNDYVLFGDFARGLWAGVFLGVEVLGLVVLVKQRRGRKGRLGACPSHPFGR